MKIKGKRDPTSLVARIVAEVQDNPEARKMLLHTLLTNEFQGKPAGLDCLETCELTSTGKRGNSRDAAIECA